MIRKEGSKYILYSQDGSKRLGEFNSQAEAENRERVINYFKSKKESSSTAPKR